MQRYGVATVLSTIVMILCLFATATIPSKSATAKEGFESDSKIIAFVLSSIKASNVEASVTSKFLASIPSLLIVWDVSVDVPP